MSAPWRAAAAWCVRTAAVVRRIVGVPDYEAYVQHARQAHPDAVLLTREQYVADRLEARYSRPGSRCC